MFHNLCISPLPIGTEIITALLIVFLLCENLFHIQSDLFSYVSPPIPIINDSNFDFCNNSFTNKFFSNPIQYLPTDYPFRNNIQSYKQIRLYLSLLLPLLRSSVSRAFLSFLPYILISRKRSRKFLFLPSLPLFPLRNLFLRALIV